MQSLLGLTKERGREHKQMKGRREAAREGPPKERRGCQFHLFPGDPDALGIRPHSSSAQRRAQHTAEAKTLQATDMTVTTEQFQGL